MPTKAITTACRTGNERKRDETFTGFNQAGTERAVDSLRILDFGKKIPRIDLLVKSFLFAEFIYGNS
jgi:hypothetical protein